MCTVINLEKNVLQLSQRRLLAVNVATIAQSTKLPTQIGLLSVTRLMFYEETRTAEESLAYVSWRECRQLAFGNVFSRC